MLQLCPPSLELYPSYDSFVEEMRQAGEKIWEGYLPASGESPKQFVQALLDREHNPQPGLVPESVFWAVEESSVVGRLGLRHTLNENLREFGGHIGYEVRPSRRKQGVAKAMLKLALATPRARAIGNILLTCAPTNTPSIKTILAHGGIFEKTQYVERFKRDTSYYWIKLR